ncbi:VWA domain-containing protein [Pedobacter ginsenosidimutans]|nr:VWA domain-containing protein [Pedobacter ginsenosidimutans]
MNRRGLEIRKTDARDNGWFNEMCKLLECPDDQLAAHLKTRKLSAEQFLRAFLQAAQPFSLMFSEIWEYLSGHLAPRAGETISIKFGFPGDESVDIDLEQFRRYEEQATRMRHLEFTVVWNDKTLNALFQLSDLLALDDWEWDDKYRYSIGIGISLPAIIIGSHAMDGITKDIRNLFQQIIDDYRQLSDDARFDPSNAVLADNAHLLTDLMPRWAYVFYNLEKIAGEAKDKAYALYQKDILPHLKKLETQREELINEALDILDLPFWKHRWHTYEIWCTVRALKSMDELSPRPRVAKGRIALDGYSKEVIADLENCRDYPDACVVIQEQTTMVYQDRKGMKPDLRVCFSSKESGKSNTAAVIEFKQRSGIEKAHIEKVANLYTLGTPKSGGMIILNYDSPGVSPSLPPKSYYIEDFRPDHPDIISAFDEKLMRLLAIAGLKRKNTNVLLIDISSSMRGLYDQEDILNALRWARDAGKVELFFFNDELVPMVIPESGGKLPTSGGTNLPAAIAGMFARVTDIGKILIVSDRDYDDPSVLLPGLQCAECYPMELPSEINGLK